MRTLKRLTSEQMLFFEKEGYVMIPDVFEPGDLDPVRSELEAMVDQAARELQDKGELDESFPQADFETRLAKISEHDVEAGRKIVRFLQGKGGGGHQGEAMFQIITHPKLLAVIEDFIGPEIVGSSVYRVRPKVPKLNDGVVPWHQDSGYFMPHCDREFIITCWLPLVDATIENGCLSVLPRADKDVVRHHTGGNAGFLEIRNENLPQGNPVPVPIPLGGAIFFNNRTPHCSTPNNSEIVRWSLDLRYQSAEVPNNVGEDPEQFDEGGPQIEMACYPPEADFVIKSEKHPEKVVRTVKEFQAIRNSYEKSTIRFPLRWSN